MSITTQSNWYEVYRNKQKIFDLWAPNYDLLFTTVFYQAVHQRLLEYVELPENPNVLDLGCGTGRLLHRLATQFPTLKGTGLDLSSQMLRQARQSNQHRPRLIFKQGNAESLPFTEGQFDAVFNTISFLHYPQPQQVLFEVNRVLGEGGRFYLVDYIGRKKTVSFSIPLFTNNLRFYSREQREQFGTVAGMECLGHHFLLGPVMLTIFRRIGSGG
ncbi:MAG: class I SAM-dependent methyltransferase [Coleofasciculus sp. G1-WW12-02]|uniref:class I SAM-dependent methyltransferase n=1 Tax=Coleofasciculus sp. G1-WW12-02 TaxID=3068483 RepID=UPI0032F5B4A1